ncbi:MAG: type VI secretion system membrane subunit TssM [Methylococcaceae bacterium]|nr:type VI secretion system membrane subunit TssM [Methylococcaceae bacterium]
MRNVLKFFVNPWVIQIIGLLALSALIWFAGPLIAVAGAVPLESAMARIAAIVALWVVWLIYQLIRLAVVGRKDRRLMTDLAQPEAGEGDEKIASDQELEILRQGFDEALKVLKEVGAGREGKRTALYEMPWYAIIGAPGSGKTTALINSGLRFPLAERLGKHSVKGVSGTRNCDWWFTDEAVLLDTAGRYTTQDSYQAVDAAAWQGFLELLKRYRPRRPLNGILVAVSVSDLLQQTEEERGLHAGAIRRRVQELYQTLGVRLPIYILLTKADLLAGFTDFFADLTPEERAQVWGETFPLEPLRPSGRFADGEGVPQRFERAYQDLLQRLHQRLLRRLQDEKDVQRRGLIIDFPQQLALLKPAIASFLDLAFAPTRYEREPLLRGFYLTSGTQEGTPIDRVMGMLAGAFRLDRQAVPVYSGRGRSYFLTRLIREVLFKEAELVGVDPRVERRWRWVQLAGYFGVALATVAVLLLWTVSYRGNRDVIAQVEEKIAQYRGVNIVPTDTRSNFKALLPRLDALQQAHDIVANEGWTQGFGLSQGDKLQAGINQAYENLLRQSFAPVIVQRLKERMQGQEGQSLDVLYQLLRVYLGFNDPSHMDPKVAVPWIKLDWEQAFSSEPETLAALNVHLGHLLQLDQLSVPQDEAFVAAVRSRLTQIPLVNQVYARFKTEAVTGQEHDFHLASVLQPTAGRVFTSAGGGDVGSLTVPALYTGWGYTEVFLKKSVVFVKDAVEQNWVLGTAARLEPADMARLHEDLKKLYLADYQRAWVGLLNGIKIKSPQNTQQAVDMLDVLGRPDSPMKAILQAVEKNTSLSKAAAAAADLLSKTAGKALPTADDVTQKALAAARQAAGLDNGPDPVRDLEAVFQPLNSLVAADAPDKPIALNGTLTQIGALHDYLMQLTPNDPSKLAPGGNDVVRQSQTEFGHLPEPVRGWLLSLTTSGGDRARSVAKAQLAEAVKAGAGAPCRAALDNRYPFYKSPQDVLLADFGKLFAPNGVIDQVFQANLKPFIDTSRSEWREMVSDKPLGLSPGVIRQFQNAARIRASFFPSGGNQPQIQFELKPLSLDNTVSAFRLNIEGQEAVYRHGPEQIVKFQWPGPSTNAGVRMVFETLDGRQISRFKEGTWAFFRLLDEISVEQTGLPDRFNLTFQAEGFSARYELRAGSVNNPFNTLDQLQGFRCPEGL